MEAPSDNELESRAGSLELYVEGITKLASSVKDHDGWLKALALALQDAANLLRRCKDA